MHLIPALLAAALAVALLLLLAIMAWPGSITRFSGRRRQVREKPFPPAWDALLRETVWLYPLIPPSLKPALQAHIQEFMAWKHFEACGGLEIPKDAAIRIAALACIPVLSRPSPIYPHLYSILLYPGAFRREDKQDIGTERILAEEVLDGESWDAGAVVLSWDAVQRQAADPAQATNVVIHEFAHQLARHEGFSDGSALMDAPSGWGAVFQAEFTTLQREAETGRQGLLDHYGATGEAEFFAVASEAFFLRPRRMRQRRPSLYEALQTYYGLDPAEWHTEPPREAL